jgi:hypothetical protein
MERLTKENGMTIIRSVRRPVMTLLSGAAAAVLLVAGGTAALATPVPAGFHSTDVSALSASQWWVLGLVPGCGSGCAAIAETTSSGASFSLVSRQPSATAVPAGATVLRMVDSLHGWLLVPGGAPGHQLYRTFDGGAAWSVVGLAHKITSLDVGDGRIWVTTVDGTTLGAWTSAATGSAVFARPLTATIATIENGPALVAQSDGSALVFAAANGYLHLRGWRLTSSSSTIVGSPYWCWSDLGFDQISAALGTTWMSCPQGTADSFGRETGSGLGIWHGGPLLGATQPAARFAVGAAGAAAAVIGVQGTGKLYRVTTAGSSAVASVPPLGGGNVSFGFIGFTDSLHGFAIGLSGALLHTSDGGLVWALVTV